MPPKPDSATVRRDPKRKRRESIEHPVPTTDADRSPVPDPHGGSEPERNTNVNTTRV
jgi:hypothetical protein